MLASRSSLLLCSASRMVSPSTFRRSLHVVIPPGVEAMPSRTSEQVIRSLTEDVIGGTSSYDPKGFKAQREKLMPYVPASQEELPERKMTDSFDQVCLTFKFVLC